MLHVVAFAAAIAQAPTLERDLTIGCESCGGALQFSSIWDVGLAANGAILVVDRDAPMIRAFDPSGKSAWATGRKGQGPGEFQLVLRAAFLPDRGVAVVDMLNRRITTLSPAGVAINSVPIAVFATTASADSTGTLLIGAEGPSGTLGVTRWRGGNGTSIAVPCTATPDCRGAFKNSSVALSPNGSIAILMHNERYLITRLDSAGRPLAPIQRAIERVRNTPAEEAELRARVAGQIGRVASEARAASGGSSAGTPIPTIPATELSLKPHASVDGLRYDPSGRLWVRTMRGNESETLFDVFSAAGAFLGSVPVPGRVQAFALAGMFLITAFEDADGTPRVVRWRVR